MRIPEARAEITEIVRLLNGVGQPALAQRLERVLPALSRRVPAARAASTARSISTINPKEIEEIITLVLSKQYTHRDIGARFGIDGARVSEIANGRRE